MKVEQQRRHAPWAATYEVIQARYAEGTSVATIARQLGISRPTVYTYLRRETPPSPRSLQRSGHVLKPCMPYLIRRWRERSTDSMQLWREIRALNYIHSARTVSRFVTSLRGASEADQVPEAQASPHTELFTLVFPAGKRLQDVQRYIEQLCQVEACMARADAVVRTFLCMVRERRGHDLGVWMAEAAHSGIEELARFARGLRSDLPAIKAGLTLAWSKRATEGQLHRLTLVKRQGYGRASLMLLRQRVLPAA